MAYNEIPTTHILGDIMSAYHNPVVATSVFSKVNVKAVGEAAAGTIAAHAIMAAVTTTFAVTGAAVAKVKMNRELKKAEKEEKK